MQDPSRSLGKPQSAELLLKELYVDLRRNVRAWSAVTRQTPQARMGYIGQHLVSVVTAYPGGRSGARGHDLVLPNGQYAEIKTCYRVDQLGQCLNCKAAVSSIESECPMCGSTTILRKDDSKWLISIRNDDEMRALFNPINYYLVLFDFSTDTETSVTDTSATEVISQGTPDINARIWTVDPLHPGFALCMVDYYVNIRANSRSNAPFNLWPYSLKFQLMRPRLIFHAVIRSDDSVKITIFPNSIGEGQTYPISSFTAMLGSYTNLSNVMLRDFSVQQRVTQPNPTHRSNLLQNLDTARADRGWSDDWIAIQLANLMYQERIADSQEWLPLSLRAS